MKCLYVHVIKFSRERFVMIVQRNASIKSKRRVQESFLVLGKVSNIRSGQTAFGVCEENFWSLSYDFRFDREALKSNLRSWGVELSDDGSRANRASRSMLSYLVCIACPTFSKNDTR